MATEPTSLSSVLNKIKSTDRIQKKWITQQLQRAASLKTLAGVRNYQKAILKMLLPDAEEIKVKSLTAGDATTEQIIEIFGLNFSENRWELSEESNEVPPPLVYNLNQLKKAFYDTSSEAYNRIAIDYLIVACKIQHNAILSKQPKSSTNDPSHQTTTTVSVLNEADATIRPSQDISPTTPLMTPQSLDQPLPIKVFPEMALSVRVIRGGQEWIISGIADWAMGYGDRMALEDGAVLIAVEAKRTANLGQAEAQLLAYLATIRQLRIQANKTNVMTQGFYSDGQKFTFICIRNDGSVMSSTMYDLRHKGDLKTVFNFLLGMLVTAAESSPHTSPTKQGPLQDEKIQNFDRDVFVKVFKEAENIGAITPPTVYHDGLEDEWPDFSLAPDAE